MEMQDKKSTAKGPAEWFAGDVWIDRLVSRSEPSPLNVASVHFAPGARTAWHSHDGGQVLLVTDGRGLIQTRGEDMVDVRPGQVISTPDGEEHWHGAAPDHLMTHLSITQGEAHWGDQVSDDDYRGRRV